MERRRAPTPRDGTPASKPERQAVLGKAVLRAAGLLGLSGSALAEILGISEASVSRMKDQSYLLDGKELELGALLVRVYRSLDALVGGNTAQAHAWLHAENLHLGGVPAQLMRRIEGLFRVAEYLDFMRGAQ